MTDKLTIFAIPKPFEGHIGTIQNNAISSWTRLDPKPDIILIGDDPGVADAAARFGAFHVPGVKLNSFGTPLLSDAFNQAEANAKTRWLMYTNADMIYTRDLGISLGQLSGLRETLICGRRWDVDVRQDLTGTSSDEWTQLFAEAPKRGKLHGPSGIDYFIFPRPLPFPLPELAVGRPGWDCWLIWKYRTLGLKVIDASQSITAIHQNHTYSSLRLGYQHWRGPERDLNYQAIGGLTRMLTLREASHHLVKGKLIRPSGIRGISSGLATFFPYRAALAAKRWVQYHCHR